MYRHIFGGYSLCDEVAADFIVAGYYLANLWCVYAYHVHTMAQYEGHGRQQEHGQLVTVLTSGQCIS